MSEPRRWKDSPGAPLGARELLGSAKRSRAMSDETFARVGTRVAKMGAVPVAAAAAAGIGFWAKAAAAGVAVLVLAGGVTAAKVMASRDAEREMREREATASAAATATAAASATATAPATASAPVVAAASAPAPTHAAPVIAAERRGSATSQAPVIAAVDRGNALGANAEANAQAKSEADAKAEANANARAPATLADELAVLQAARQAIGHDPETALAKAREHRAKWPAGALAAERDLVELDALRRTGRTELARSRADAWLAREPAGVYAARVRAIRDSLE